MSWTEDLNTEEPGTVTQIANNSIEGTLSNEWVDDLHTTIPSTEMHSTEAPAEVPNTYSLIWPEAGQQPAPQEAPPQPAAQMPADNSKVYTSKLTDSWYSELGKVESNNNYSIKANKNGYEGRFQFRYRPGDDGYNLAKKMGVSVDAIRKSPALQDDLMRRATAGYDKELKKHGIPVSNYTRWLRHNQGMAGARLILGKTKGSDRLRRIVKRNLKNQAVKGNSLSELITNYHKKFRKKFS